MNCLKMRLRIWQLILLSLVIFIVPVYGSEISVSSRIDKTEIAFDEEVNLTIELSWVGSLQAYSFELMPLPKVENLKVAGSSSSISSFDEDGETSNSRIFKYSFQPTRSGTGLIHPIVFNYISWPDSIPGHLTTQEYQLFIAKPKPVVKEPDSNMLFHILVMGGIIILFGTIFVIYKKKKSAVPTEIIISPEEKIVKDIDEVKKAHHADRRTFFAALYKIIGGFLKSKYDIDPTGKTTAKLIDEIIPLEINIDLKDKLTDLLKLSETEKFAPTRGEPGDILRLCAELETFFGKINNNDKSEAK